VIRAVERCTDGRNCERFWVLDPIDGTRGFLAKRGYVVGLALIVHGVCVLSVMGCPAIGSILASVKGRGSILVSLDEQEEEVYPRFETHPLRKGAKSLTSWTFSGSTIPVMPLLLGPSNPPDRLCCGEKLEIQSNNAKLLFHFEREWYCRTQDSHPAPLPRAFSNLLQGA